MSTFANTQDRGENMQQMLSNINHGFN